MYEGIDDIDKYNEELSIESRKNRFLVSANILKDIDFIRPIEIYDKVEIDDDINFGEITGRVTVKGKPIANTAVFLNKQYGGIGNGISNTYSSCRGISY